MLVSLAAAVMSHGQSRSVMDSELASAKTSTSEIMRLVVNGKQFVGKTLLKDGSLFVSIEDLARESHGTLSYKQGGVLDLSLPCGGEATQPLGFPTGRVRGTITYYFNANFGNKPDVGTEVWLAPGKLPTISPDKSVFAVENRGILVSGGVEYPLVKRTIADGNGTFEMDGVEPGEYTLVLKSKHTKGDISKRGVEAVTKRDGLGRIVALFLKVEQGKTSDASYDFGISSFSDF